MVGPQPFLPWLTQSYSGLGPERHLHQLPQPRGRPCSLPERTPAGVDPGRELGAWRAHRGLAAPVHADTPLDPISTLQIASWCAATTKLERNDRRERIK